MKKALVLSLAVVLGLGVASFAQTLSGSWDTTVSITPTPVVTLGIDSELIVTYAVSGWSFTSDTTLDETGWQGQEFDVSGALGAFTLGSTLIFDPASVEFTSWEVTGGLSIAGVNFSADFTLEPGVTSLEITGSGTAGNVDVSIDLTLGGVDCNLTFNEVVIDVGFPFCCADVLSEIAFNCEDGFEYVSFAVDGIAVPALPWVTLDALLTFTVDSKTLVLTPNFDFGATACFELYIAQANSGNLTLGDFYIDGIGLQCTIGGVQFYGLSFWGEHADKPEILGDYWEMYQITTTDDGCCGPFDFTISLFFDTASTQLFTVSLVQADMSIQIAQQFTFTMGISIDLDAAPASFTEWTLGFEVTW